jgi:hypothetical protein
MTTPRPAPTPAPAPDPAAHLRQAYGGQDGGGNFNPNITIDTSMASVAPPVNILFGPGKQGLPVPPPTGHPNFESGGAVGVESGGAAPGISSQQRSLLEQLTAGPQTPNLSDVETRMAAQGFKVKWEPAADHQGCQFKTMYGARFCADHSAFG